MSRKQRLTVTVNSLFVCERLSSGKRHPRTYLLIRGKVALGTVRGVTGLFEEKLLLSSRHDTPRTGLRKNVHLHH